MYMCTRNWIRLKRRRSSGSCDTLCWIAPPLSHRLYVCVCTALYCYAISPSLCVYIHQLVRKSCRCLPVVRLARRDSYGTMKIRLIRDPIGDVLFVVIHWWFQSYCSNMISNSGIFIARHARELPDSTNTHNSQLEEGKKRKTRDLFMSLHFRRWRCCATPPAMATRLWSKAHSPFNKHRPFKRNLSTWFR